MTAWLDWDTPNPPEQRDEDEAYDDWRQELVDRGEWPERPGFNLQQHCQDLARLGATPEQILVTLTPDEIARLPY
jgi:hypothetical protein